MYLGGLGLACPIYSRSIFDRQTLVLKLGHSGKPCHPFFMHTAISMSLLYKNSLNQAQAMVFKLKHSILLHPKGFI